MKPVFVTAIVSVLLFTAGCGSESSLPTPTGKGSIRAINAINTSPQFNFLIEERSLGTVGYKGSSTPRPFDDFEYNFNFEVVLAGDVIATRVASRVQKIDADQEYTFVLTGSIDAPTVTVWEKPEREFTEDETVFELQIAHLAEGFPTVDVFVAPEGTAPVVGEEVATLAFGELMPVREFESGDYVVTVTEAGDPSVVVFQSGPVTFGARNSLLVGVFAPTGNDIDPLSIIGFISNGDGAPITDASSSPTLRLIHSSQDIGNVDIYDDEALTSLFAGDLAFKDISGDLEIAAGAADLRITPAGSTETILLEGTVGIGASTRNNLVVFGAGGTYDVSAYIPDRTSVQTVTKLSLFNGASNLESVDVYAVGAGTDIEEDSVPRIIDVRTGARSPSGFIVTPGSYDLYATLNGERNAVAGPVTIDVARGDVIELILFDTVAPDVGELTLVPAP
ncbi:MAG: DUF4397 domain-containing protein [Woeseiaceae bacterium]|nr:DUF4397 domain-containing protein [Woeseiaceae bacterium]